MRVQASFAPWKPVALPKQVMRERVCLEHLHREDLRPALREAACAAQNDSVVEGFDRARVSYVARDGTRTESRIRSGGRG